MATSRILSIALMTMVLTVTSAFAQNRDIRAQRLIIDDNAGHTIKMQTATVGLSSYTLTWPLTAGTNNYALVTNGPGGVLSWKSIQSLSNSWGLNGNTLLGPEVLGSLNNFPLVLVTDSVERMRITSTGNVGIGTALPVEKLQVSGNLLIDSGRQAQFQTPAGDYVTTFNAGAQIGNINYTLPLTSPDVDGYILSSTSGGVMSWISPTSTYKYENGLTLTFDTVRLGGSLTKNTSIPFGTYNLTLSSVGDAGNLIIGKFTTSGIVKNNASGVLSSGKVNLNDTTEVAGTLGITNGGTGNNLTGSAGQVIYFDGTKYEYTSTGTAGQVLQSNGALQPTWTSISSLVKANNGVSMSVDTVQLGGTLLKNTSIPFGSNDLTLSSPGNTGNIIIGKFTTSGIVKNNASGVLSSGKINLNDTNEVTGTLGVTNGGTGNNTVGSAGQVIYFDGTKYTYTSTGTSGQILKSNGSGAPTWVNPQATLTYNNGLTVTNDTLQLGGALIKNTSIPFGSNDLTLSSAGNTGNIIIGKFTTSGIVKNNASGVLSSGKINLNDTNEVTGTLGVTNGGTGNNTVGSAGQVIYFDGTKYTYTSTGTSGQILKSNGSGAPTWVNPQATLTYNNGLTVTNDTLQLGGALIKNTSIPFGSNDLTLSSAGNTGNIIIGKFTSAGIVKNNASGVLTSGQVNLASASDVTGTLGITNGGTGNTVIGAAGTVAYSDGTKYTFTTAGSTGDILQLSGSTPTWTSVSSIVKANNGLSMSADTVQLGGALTKNTSIPFGSNNLTLSSAGNTGNIIIGKFTTSGIVKNNASGVLSSGKINLNDTTEVTGTLGVTNGGTGNNTVGSAGQVIYFDGTKYTYTSTGTSGQILKSNGSGAPTWVNPQATLTYNNGLTVTNDTLQLGGTLIKNTSIPFGSNDLTLSSAGNTGNIIIGKFTSAGIVKNNASGVLTSGQVNLASASDVTGTLGITNGGTGNTVIGAAGTVAYSDGTKYTFTTAGSTGDILQLSGSTPTWTSVSSIVKANNGLSMSADTVQLGGALTKNTSIPFGSNNLTLSSAGNTGNIIIGKFTTSGIVKNNASGVLSSGKINLNDTTEVTGTLGVTNGGTGNNTVGSAGQVIYFDGTKYTYTSTGTSGQVLKSNGSGAPTWVNPQATLTYNNGLTVTNDTLQLGGALIKNTSIPFGSNDLTLSSAGNTGNIIIGKFTSAGIVKNNASGVLSSGQVNLASASEVTGTLGVTNGGTGNTSVGLAGTVAYSDGTKYTFNPAGTSGQILQLTGGVPTWTSVSAIVKANNGLSLSADTVQLGGTLTKATTIPFGSNDLTLSSAGNTGNIIIGKFTSAGIVKNNASGVLSSGQVNLASASEVTGTLGVTNGGTGNTTVGVAGTVAYSDGTKYTFNPAGTSGQILQLTGGVPTWTSVSAIVKANNGLSLSADTVQLGGTLTKATTIPFGSNDLTLSSAGNTGNIIIGKFTSAGIVKNNASGVLSSGQVNLASASEVTGTLGITNGGTNNTTAGTAGQVVYYDGTKYNYSTTGTSGQLLQSNGAGQPTWVSVSNIVKANNGLSLSTDTVQLGGTLTKNTSIPFGSNDLTLSSAGNTGNIIIGKFTSAGIVKNNASGVLSSGQVNLASASEVTGTLGITNGGTNNTTAGSAGQVVYYDGTKYNYSTTGTSGQLLQSNGAGQPTWVSVSNIVKANNGLSLSTDTVQLGGTLTKNTSIPFGSNDLTLSSAGNTGNIIIGKFTSAGIVKNNASGVLSSGQVNLASASEVTGTLGITNGGTNNTTAGTAGQVVYYDGTKYNYSTTGTSGQLLQSNGAGQPTWVSVSNIVKANNGVSLSTDTVQLGGALTKATTITGGAFDLSFQKSGTGNVNLTNSNNTANQLRFYEPSSSGSNFTAFQAPAQAGDVTYTLPNADGSAGQILSTNGSGVLSWASAGLTGSGVATRVAFWSGTSSLSSNANLYWDNTNSRLGVGTSTPGNSITTTGNIELTTSATSKVIGSNGNLTFEQTGDTYGTTRLSIQNRNGVNGAMFEQAGTVDLVDFVFKGLANQRNIRFENRPASSFVANPEFQIGPAAGPTLVVADNASAFRNGTLVVGKSLITSGLTLEATGNIGLSNSGSASELRLFEPSASGSNFSAFKAQAQTADLKYVMPATGGTANQVLTILSKTGASATDTTLTLGWTSLSAGGTDWSLTGNAGTSPATNFLGTTDAQDLELRVNGSPLSATSRRIRLYTTGGLQRFDGTTTPTSPGSGSVDWQSSRSTPASQVASGTNSVIGGGSNNTSSNTNSTIAGGTTNTASGITSTVGGGTTNTASNQNATVAGGSGNTASGIGSTISGGVSNTASNQNTTISGGTSNTASGITATIGGGTTNTANNQNTTIGGGSGNTASGIGSTVGGGVNNTATGSNSVIPGGNGLTVGGNSIGFSGSTSSANASSIGNNLAYFGDVNVIVGNIDNAARELRFYEANASTTYAGANYTSFKAGTQAADLIYTLPTTAPTAGQVLTSSGGGTSTLSWSSVGAATVTAANNGLLLSGTTVQLGGTLIRNTIDTLGNFNMDFFKTGTGNLRLTNNGTANQLQLLEPSASGTNFSAFLSQAQTSDLKYVMPATGGTANQVLTIVSKSGAAANDTTLTLGWANATAGGTNWDLLGNATTDSTINFLGTTDAKPMVVKTNNTERIRVLASGNVGVGTATPAVQLDVNGGIAARPSTQTITTNTAITVGNRTYIRLTNTTGTNWTITLSNGLQDGQLLILQFNYTGAGMLLLNDSGNLNLSGNFQPAFTQSSITLIWDGTSWVETARSLN
ncbi:MAG: hypothetical protein U0264_14570 [Candidatus Kapaibacterium sp.]